MQKIFLLLIMLMLVTGCGNSGEKIIVGVDENFPPMGFRDTSGELVGFDIDLAKETAKRMGVEFVFKPIDWNNKRDEILSGNVDIIWNGLDINDECKEYMIFSNPYLDNRQILLVKHGNPKDIHTLSELSGKVVGTQAGSNQEIYINATPKIKNIFADFNTYRNFKDAFAALVLGNVDALIIDEIAARYEVTVHPDVFETVEVTIGPATKCGIGFRKDDVELRDRVQQAFDAVIKDGTAKKISEQWFQANLIKRR